VAAQDIASATDIHRLAAHLGGSSLPQVGSRHRDSLAVLKGQAAWISVDPRRLQPQARPRRPCEFLSGASAFLPSTQEIKPILDRMSPDLAVEALFSAGFPEVVLKRGSERRSLPLRKTALQSRSRPFRSSTDRSRRLVLRRLCREPVTRLRSYESVRRAAISAALVVGCSGAEQPCG